MSARIKYWETYTYVSKNVFGFLGSIGCHIFIYDLHKSGKVRHALSTFFAERSGRASQKDAWSW